jgi:RimJ/RimL family protein N-acetyltransferase
VIPVPDPPLRSGELVLRPWRLEDASSLVAAWEDEDIQRWTAVPEVHDLEFAERWILGQDERRRRELSLDLVIERHQRVAGEVGLSALRRRRGTVEIGWWTMPGYRREGIASTAARLVVEWASATLGVAVIARCDAANPGSVAVAERAGAMVLL